MTGRARAILAASFLATALAAPARTAIAEEKYETLFAEGRARMDARDYDKACELFKESLDLGAPVGALLNLAACEDKRGHPARSLSLWKEGLAKLPASDPRRDLAQRSIEDVDQRVAKIAVVWAHGPPGARAFVDGKATTIGGDPELVDPGAHKVTVNADQGSRVLDVTVASGELKSVDLGAGLATRPPPSTGSGLLVGAGVAFGLAGAAAIGAGISGGVYLDGKSTVDTKCPVRDHCDDADALEARDRARAAGAANVAMFVIGGVAVATGVTLVVLHVTRSKQGAPGAGSIAVRITGAGAALGGSF